MTLTAEGAEDFLHWAVPEEHAVLDAVEESAGLPKELLARSRTNCAAGREHSVRSSGQVNRDQRDFSRHHADPTDGYRSGFF
jgi:hypothetical protein